MTTLALDMDGTIFDCSEIVADAFREGAHRFGEDHGMDFRIPSRDEIMSIVGSPTEEIFIILFPGLSASPRAELIEMCQRILADMVRRGGGLLFPGVKEILRGFYDGGYRIFAASNGTIEYISAILETHGLIGYFMRPITVIGDDIRNKSDIVRHYRENVLGDDMVIMVGDRASDLAAARDNGIPFIGCAYGYAGESDIAGQKWIAHDVREIPSLVREIERGMI